jgi:glutaminyl-tRNA synthetase
MLLMTMLVVVVVEVASQRKVAGTLHWVSIKHAVDAEVRLYDRLFIDVDVAIKKTFGIQNSNSLKL